MRLAPRRLLVVALLAALLAPAGVATAQPSSPSAAFAVPAVPVPEAVLAALAAGPTDVVVSYDPERGTAELRRESVGGAPTDAGVEAAAEAYAEAKDAALEAADDVRIVRDFEHLPVQIVRADSIAALEELAAEPGVSGISLPATYRLQATDNLEIIRQPGAVAAGFTGAGTAVAVLDTGLNPAFSPGLYGGCAGGPGTGSCRVDFQSNANGSSMVDLDPERHGSNVTSVAATVAPQTHIWSYGVFVVKPDSSLATSTEIVLNALDHLLDNAPAGYVRAVNLSLGDPTVKFTAPCGGSPFASTFTALRAAGIVPVVAAGNGAWTTGSFQSGVPDPACVPGAVAVGAVYSTATLSTGWGAGPECIDINPQPFSVPCFSQTGPLLSMLAPGVDVPGAGVELSGTSQAAPHVAGAVAALFHANSSASLGDVVDALTTTGTVITDNRTSPATSRRLLDVQGAAQAIAAADVRRLSGADRIATAIATSKASFPTAGSAGAVVLASSQAFPDGLAGTPLAIDKNAPLLLTAPDALSGDVLAEVQRALPAGGMVYVLGGTTALSTSVASSLSGAGFQVQRVAGPDRYATAVAIADAVGSPSTVLLATGLNFPDALSAGVAAGHVGGVVLFTQNTTQAPATKAWLDAHGSVPRVIVGGTASGTAPGATELVGADRFETATKVATHFFGSAATVVGVASGTVFPDALSGGAHVARLGGPILLTNPGSLPPVATSWLRARRTTVTTVYIYGGTTAINGAAADQVRAAT